MLPFVIVFTRFGPQVGEFTNDFAKNVMQRKANLYGFAEGTLDSLMLKILPPIGHEYKRIPLKQNEGINVDKDVDVKVSVLKCLLDALRESAGFQIPKVCTGWPSSEMILSI